MKIGKYNLELKQFKHVESLSEETECFSAELYVNGLKFASCRNRGQGGPTDIDPYPEHRGLEGEIIEYLKTQPKHKYGEYELDLDLELVVDLMVEELMNAKVKRKLTNQCKKALLFENTNGVIYSVKWKNADIAKLRSSRNGIESMIEIIEREVAKGAKLINENVSLEMLQEVISHFLPQRTLPEKINKMFADYVSANGHEPRYAMCSIKYLDDNTTLDCTISLCNTINDDNAFFYCNSLNDLISLTDAGCEEFIVTDCIEFFNL
ncbi:MAG: hypothetical protein SNJ29_10570 [Rikenellaceae bacterium]